VTLRARMTPSEVVGADGTVGATRLLALFSDAAKELLIRLDGDEGQLASFRGVEFLEPAQPGDFVEVTGMVTQVGSTARHLAFEARRVATLTRDPSLAPTAADALREPVPLCRAIATCIVPEPRQRRPRIVLPALTAPAPDAVGLPEPHPIVTPAPHFIVTPVSPELMITAELSPGTASELAERAAACRDDGASVVVLPPLELGESAGEKHLEQALAEIRRRTSVLVAVPLSAAAASLEVGRPSHVDVAELECRDLGDLERVLERFRRAPVEACVVRVVLGAPGGAPRRPEVLHFLVSQLPESALWGFAEHGAVEDDVSPTFELGLTLGGHIRVSADQVASARIAAERLGRVPVDPARARQLLGLVRPE